ncbi:hypothetical protein ABT340_09445 [Streptosporangium sp. NPDC000239]|uniref:hypothetical protein n=1 Tax=Streptosporangium sp. NPDC000239 TaxID=3154248 RepID=UPI0033214D80
MVLLLVLSGCGTPGPTITKAQAMAVVDGYMGRMFKAVRGPVFTRTAQGDFGGSCVYPIDGPATGQINPGREFWTDPVSEREGRAYLDAVVAFWGTQPGARVAPWMKLSGEGFDAVEVWPIPDSRYRLLVEYFAPPGIRKVHVVGELDECIWETGTAPPEPDPDPDPLMP